MKNKWSIYFAIPLTTFGINHSANAEDDFIAALSGGKVSADFRLRYEDVEKGDLDSDGLTLRTRLGYTTGAYKNVTATVEFEDVRDVFDMEDEEELILDPEVTELDQGFLQYQNQGITTKLGRQVLTHDGHRHIGHVGWRQDRQTFDAFRVMYKGIENLSLDFAHLYKRNRIVAEAADVRANDYLLNVSYKTPYGKLAGYGYSLENEANDRELETVGFSFKGKAGEDIKFLYAFEFASQEASEVVVDTDVDTDTEYSLFEGGVSVSGITAKLGMETLGSDDGVRNFATPLATVHKFSGWADQFAGGSITGKIAGGNGLVDTYFSIGGKVAGVKLLAVYHGFETDEESEDLGSEIDLLAVKKINKNYTVGAKYADFSEQDDSGLGDKSILWLWANLKI